MFWWNTEEAETTVIRMGKEFCVEIIKIIPKISTTCFSTIVSTSHKSYAIGALLHVLWSVRFLRAKIYYETYFSFEEKLHGHVIRRMCKNFTVFPQTLQGQYLQSIVTSVESHNQISKQYLRNFASLHYYKRFSTGFEIRTFVWSSSSNLRVNPYAVFRQLYVYSVIYAKLNEMHLH